MTKWKRNAGFFIGGQFISMLGSMLVQYAITWHITLTTLSGEKMALFICAGMLPMVIISPFAGVWADRYNRKNLIIFSDAAIALATLVLAILFFIGYESMLMMLVVVTIRGFGQGVQQPAVNALIPQIVPQEHLTRFNGIQSASQSITMFASPMLAGMLLTYLPIEYIFFIDVGTAIIGIFVVLFFVDVPKLSQVISEKGIASYFNDIKQGVSYILSIGWLKFMFVYMAFFCVFMTPASILTPLQVARSFDGDVRRLTAIELLFSAGMALGGLLISVWGGFKNKVNTIILGCFAFGVTTVLFGVITNFYVYLGVMLICGMTAPFFNVASMTIMQTRIEPQLMGRVFSVMMMINGLAMPVGSAVFGPLSDGMRIEILLIVTGVLLFVSGFFLICSKTLKAAGDFSDIEINKENIDLGKG